jgi:HSP20 family protein
MAYLTFYNPYHLANRDEKNDSTMEQFNNKFNHSCNCVPASNIVETDNEYRIEMALPGVDKNDIRVKHEKGYLYVNVERKEDQNETKYDRYEFNYSGASRVFKTGELINSDEIAGKYENGILVLTLPKKEEFVKKPAQSIQIQ